MQTSSSDLSAATMVKKKVSISASAAARKKNKAASTKKAKTAGKMRCGKAERELAFDYFHDKKKRIDHNKLQASADYCAELQAKEALWAMHPTKNFNQNMRRHSIDYLAELDAGGGRKRGVPDSDDDSEDDDSDEDNMDTSDDDDAEDSESTASVASSECFLFPFMDWFLTRSHPFLFFCREKEGDSFEVLLEDSC